MSRMVVGRPSIASSRPTKSSRWSGSSASSAARRASSVSASTSRSMYWRRSPRNWCSVRHSPTPSAPRARARRASSAVSALARTCIRRTGRRAASTRSTAVTSARASGSRRGREPGVQPVGDVDHHRGVDHRDLAAEHLARGPVDRDGVPRAQHLAAHPDLAAGRVDVELLGPDHGARAHARAPRPPRATSCRRGRSGRRRRRSCPAGRPGWSPGGPGSRGRRPPCARAPARCPARSRPRPHPGTPASRGSAAAGRRRVRRTAGTAAG